MGLDRQTGTASGRAVAEQAAIVKRFDNPERVLVLDKGRLEVITVGGKAIGKGSYAPGWRWSRCVTVPASARGRPLEQVGVVLTGRSKVLLPDEGEIDLTPGAFFHISGEYDQWVVGYRPCEILYVSGVEDLVRQVHRGEAPPPP